MGRIDKRELTVTEVDTVVDGNKVIKLNLGSGFRKIEGYVNLDNRAVTEPDIVQDIALDGLPFEDSSVDEVFCRDFLEHVPIGRTIFVVEEIWRVLKKGGKFESLTPSTDQGSRGAFQDPTHCSFWNSNSFLYYMDRDYRNLYSIKAEFVGNIETFVANKQLQVLYVHAILTAVKE